MWPMTAHVSLFCQRLRWIERNWKSGAKFLTGWKGDGLVVRLLSLVHKTALELRVLYSGRSIEKEWNGPPPTHTQALHLSTYLWRTDSDLMSISADRTGWQQDTQHLIGWPASACFYGLISTNMRFQYSLIGYIYIYIRNTYQHNTQSQIYWEDEVLYIYI